MLPAALTAAGVAVLSFWSVFPAWAEGVLLGLAGRLFLFAAAWVLHRRRLREAVDEITSKFR